MLLTEEYKNLAPIDSSLLGTVIDLKYGKSSGKLIPITPDSKLEAVKLKTKETHRFDYVIENILPKPEVAMIIFRAENRQLIAVAMDNDENGGMGKNIISMMAKGRNNSYSSSKYIIVWTDFATEPFNDYPNTWIEGYSSDNFETTASKNRAEKLVSDTVGGYYDAKTRMIANKIGMGSEYTKNELTDEQKNELKVAVGKRTWNILVLYKDPKYVDLKQKRADDKAGTIPLPHEQDYERYNIKAKELLKSRLVKYKIDRLPNIKTGEQLVKFFEITDKSSRVPAKIKMYNKIWTLGSTNSKVIDNRKLTLLLRYIADDYTITGEDESNLYAMYELNMPTGKLSCQGLEFNYSSTATLRNISMNPDNFTRNMARIAEKANADSSR